MYLPRAFVVQEVGPLHDLIERSSFGTLIVPRAGEPPEIAHLPFWLDRAEGGQGTIFAHMARANPLWRLFGQGTRAVVVFQGPHGYISPRWYAERAEVPTWNYAVVHAHGEPVVLDQPGEKLDLLARLARAYEGERTDAWSLADVSDAALEHLTRSIVGFRLPIERLEGKFKLGQNRELADRQGAIEGLRREGGAAGGELADWMEATLRP